MLREVERKDLEKLQDGHFSEPAKIVLNADSLLRYSFQIDTEGLAKAGFALLDPSPANLKVVASTLQQQHQKMTQIVKEFERTVEQWFSWLRWAEVWMVYKSSVPVVAEIASEDH